MNHKILCFYDSVNDMGMCVPMIMANDMGTCYFIQYP